MECNGLINAKEEDSAPLLKAECFFVMKNKEEAIGGEGIGAGYGRGRGRGCNQEKLRMLKKEIQ